jgi:outer membrane biosynthesis protein TonB
MPRDVQPVRPVGHGLDQQALAAVSRYRFTPAMKNGEPVPVKIMVEVNFQFPQ